MALRKYVPSVDAASVNMKSLTFSSKGKEKAQVSEKERSGMDADVDIDLREVYFLIMHFLSAGPCERTYGQLWNELLEHQLLPRRYHAWYSRSGAHSGDENDDGLSFPLSYNKLVERYPHVEKDHLVKLLKQLILGAATPSRGFANGHPLNAASVPTLLGTGSFSLLNNGENNKKNEVKRPPSHMRWPHMQADQVRGLSLREIGGGFSRHHRAPSIRAACYAIAKPSTMVQKMQNIKKLRGHRNAVYCAIFDRAGRYVITGSDDRLVKIWSMDTAYCLASCRGHEGDITDLAVNFNNTLVASASNDCIIRVWRFPDGLPISVLRGHTGAVTAIAFSPRPSSVYQLLSSSDDGSCRIWDARYSHFTPRIYVPRPPDPVAGKNNGPSSSSGQQGHQIFCCAFNASGTVFVTGSSDTLARVWNACKSNVEDSDQPNHEMDVLAGHENDVNYVQFSGCAVASRYSISDASKEDNLPKFKNTWFTHDNIVTCSRDGSAIIWIPRSRRSHGKVGRWTRAYHLKVPPPPIPPQPPRGGPRQRILPTPRGVNMIVWSLDNRFVLAAIMDCRICVWNAVDGSLVHSLTGHTESTYVLDVHPFNPRIAMSAGYDGKTIVWDIWEGIPIRIYEIGRFKLVDGKFSPDGTSIILSDDVGQLYILNTGQGESQKDAKYDQFFLGDYRPLIQDTHGNVLDQETQLVPYRRNMQDLLCDSGMIPYPEPYQSMYQQRRLGALGFEWRPSTLRFAVGVDFTLDQDYQMLPIADLDILIDPLPEFLDAMDWEPENELVQSEDTDSEYNVTDSGAEQASLSSHSSGDRECSAEDSEVENTHEDFLRRSRRKNQKAEIEIMTSSGRRVKRKNLDEYDENSYRNSRHRKSKNGKKSSKKKKSSLSKSLRPQRAAARNALNLFSRITGTSTTDGEEEEEEDGSEGDSSESESTLQDSNIGSEESDVSLHTEEQNDHSKGKAVILYEPDDVVKPEESTVPIPNKRRLVLKLPNRDPNKLVIKDTLVKCVSQSEVGGSSSSVPQVADELNTSGNIERSEEVKLSRVDHHVDLLEGYNDGKINKWGFVKARTSKRPRVCEPLLPSPLNIKSYVNENGVSEKDSGTILASTEIEIDEAKVEEIVEMIERNFTPVAQEDSDEYEYDEKFPIRIDNDIDDRPTTSSVPYINGAADKSSESKENTSIIPTKLRIRSKTLSSGHETTPTKIRFKSSVAEAAAEDSRTGASEMEKNINTELTDFKVSKRPRSVLGDHHHGGISEEAPINLPPTNRMFNAVYRRSKSIRAKRSLEVDNDRGTEASTSNAAGNLNNIDEGIEPTNEGIRRTRSMGLGSACNLSVGGGNGESRAVDDGSEGTSTSVERSSQSINGCDEIPREGWRSSSRVNVGVRSTRNRRSSYNTQESSPSVDKRKSSQSAKSSWLMLISHEIGPRYIPQRGDEVAYFIQGHKDYLEKSGGKEAGPWRNIKGKIGAVEFCKVEELEYSTHPGSGESCCKMTLKFIDPMSNVAGKSFKLTLPEVTGFPDFLVERSRYDAALERNWTSRDKCQVYWKNEGSEDGEFWPGRIISVNAISAEYPDSPWERFVVQYRSNPPETHTHSPWELHDDGIPFEQPHLDDDIRDALLLAFAKLEQSANKPQDYYGVQRLKQASQKSNFLNRFPVPLSLEVIQSRLENNYYRSLVAVKHDIEVMLFNAEMYFARNAEVLAKLRRLSSWFTKTLSPF